MAENLVSKFTVNSQGTDIDVKIKDEDARNLIAQEISDRESADTAITNNLNKEISDRSKLIKADENNNTVIETSNKLIEKSSDREINVNGTSAETYTGAVTRNYEQPVNETYSGVYNIASGDKKFNVIATHNFIFATDYGVSETSDDNSDKLNELLANNDCVILPAGTYKFAKPINIFRSGATVILIGTIQSTADWAIKIKGVAQNVSARYVTGYNNGIQILDGDVASGGSVFSFDVIDATKIGLELNCSHENSGIQTCNFYLNRISFGTIGIHFTCSSNGNWINQNVFENFWCFPKEDNTGIGIKMEKGAGQTEYNQNHFDNFSCERCNLYVDLAYAYKNYFNDFRAIENSGARILFKLASDTNFNIFRTSEHLHFSDLDDHGYSNIYNAVFEDENNAPKTDKIILIDGWYYLCNGLTNKFTIINTNTGLKLDDYFTKFLVQDPTEDTVIILSPTYGNPFTAFPFWVETGSLKSHKVILELFSGRKLFENFEDYHKYLFTPITVFGDYSITVF